MNDMQFDYDNINQEVNRLAVIMVSYNPNDINKTHIKSISNEIAQMLFETYERGKPGFNQYGDEIRSIRLFVKGKSTERKEVPNSVFIDALFELLGRKKDGSWVFNSENSTFITAFHYRLSKRLLDYHNKKTKFNEQLMTDRVLKSINDNRPESNHDKLCNKWSAFAIILEAMGKFSNKLSNLTTKEQKYFEGFFTYDRTENIKSDDELGIVACEYNDTLFPYMVIKLLEFLMTGNFSSMHDILSNPLREGVVLKQRGELLKKYFCYSHPTQVKYSQKYNELWAAIVTDMQ